MYGPNSQQVLLLVAALDFAMQQSVQAGCSGVSTSYDACEVWAEFCGVTAIIDTVMVSQSQQ